MTSRRRRTTMSDVYATHLQGIVCISGTSRPDNYTARALGIVVDELHHSRVAPVVFDARALQLAFPGHPDPGDGERLRTAIAAAPGVILATPEYHGSFCAMTKLIIENLGFPSVLAGKPVALVGIVSWSPIGGLHFAQPARCHPTMLNACYYVV